MRLRRSIAALLITTLTLLLTSCGINTNLGVWLWDEHTASVDVDMSLPAKVENFELEPLTVCEPIMVLGQKLHPYVENGRAGCRASGPIPAEAFKISDGSGLERADGKLTLTLKEPIKSLGLPEELDWQALGIPEDVELPPEFSETSVRFSVTFPGEVLENSGSSTVEGRTVTWTDPEEFKGTISATSVMPSRMLVPILFIIGGIALFSGAIVWWFTARESTKSNPQGTPAGAPPPSGH